MTEYCGSDKETVKILTELLVRKGIKRIVISPGSRNAPLIISLVRKPELEHFVVLDERSAAFFALGMAQRSGEPVALACTSGTALLNYAPAVAEAWYQRIPLIVLSADRPEEWIDQDDSQTIRQSGIFDKIVKYTCSLPAEIRDDEAHWYVNRLVNDALNTALSGRKGPVHINIPLREPLYGCRQYTDGQERLVSYLNPLPELAGAMAEELMTTVNACSKIMILAGFLQPDNRVDQVLTYLAGLENVVVLTESLTNAGKGNTIPTIDRVLATVPEEERSKFSPDLLISFGGPLVSKHVKAFVRKYPPRWHWSIDQTEHPADTFKVLTTVVRMEPGDFLLWLRKKIEAVHAEYAALWRQKRELAAIRHEAYLNKIGWSDLKAYSQLFPAIPRQVCLQVSNSTPVRYAQLFDYPQVERTDGNRGTSGIDGSTSTAVGASRISEGITLLLTGDMSFLYDSNALWNNYMTPRLKIIVMKNGGGAIFRFIPGPGDLEELEECFETEREVNVQGFAVLHHFAYYKASGEEELKNVLPEFFKIDGSPAILEIDTPRFENDRILKGYFKYLATGIIENK